MSKRITFAELSQVVAAAGGRLYPKGGEFRIARDGKQDLILEVHSENKRRKKQTNGLNCGIIYVVEMGKKPDKK